MSIKNMKVRGIRSFKNNTEINFAIPNGNDEGSGLNILVGPNNSGKSSLIETLYIANQYEEIIPIEIRNLSSKNGINIEIIDNENNKIEIYNNTVKSAFVSFKKTDRENKELTNFSSIGYILPQKRSIDMNFYNNTSDRESFERSIGGTTYRANNSYSNIGSRFIEAYRNYNGIFNWELEYILGYLPNWFLDSDNGNNLTINFQEGEARYKSQGCGDGFINLFVILTALYDARNNSTIIIDEPEVSLHPDIQKRLMERLLFHSKDKQIIISTHSPYFIDLNIIKNGGKLLRFVKENYTTKIYSLDKKHSENIEKLNNAVEQPYLTDIKAKEIFFFDKIILVEGIDDIYGYKVLFEKYDYKPKADFYGWGIGGADRLSSLLAILNDLGFKKILILFDGNKKEELKKLSKTYTNYLFLTISANDIRDKEAPNLKKIKSIIKNIKKNYTSSEDSKTILDIFLNDYIESTTIKGIFKDRSKKIIYPEYETEIKDIIEKSKEYFKDKKTKKYEKFVEDSDNETAKRLLEKFVAEHPELTTNYLIAKYFPENIIGSGGGRSKLTKKDEKIYTIEFENFVTFERLGDKQSKIFIEINLKNMSNPVTILKTEEK